MEKNFVGTKLFIDEIVPKAKSLLDNFCQQKVADEVMNAYGDIAVAQSKDDPRVLLISFKFAPIFTLTWVDLTYSINI